MNYLNAKFVEGQINSLHFKVMVKSGKKNLIPIYQIIIYKKC